MEPWEEKAHRRIAAMCLAAFHQANTTRNGTRRRRTQPYSVPALAQTLVTVLGRQDEEGAKRIFLNYDAYPGDTKRSSPHTAPVGPRRRRHP